MVERSKPPKPALVRLFEAAAAIMDLDEKGCTRLELEFKDGHLVRWHLHDHRNGHDALGQYDARASALLARLVP